MRPLVRIVSVCAFLAALSGCDGCTGGEPIRIVDRVWVTNLPDDPRASMKIIWIFDMGEAAHLGGYIIGSQYRNRHERFHFHPTGDGIGRIEMLQDGRVHRVRATSCEPTEGFDLCMELHGDPTANAAQRDGAEGRRYFSREEWERDADDGAPDIAMLLAH